MGQCWGDTYPLTCEGESQRVPRVPVPNIGHGGVKSISCPSSSPPPPLLWDATRIHRTQIPPLLGAGGVRGGGGGCVYPSSLPRHGWQEGGGGFGKWTLVTPCGHKPVLPHPSNPSCHSHPELSRNLCHPVHGSVVPSPTCLCLSALADASSTCCHQPQVPFHWIRGQYFASAGAGVCCRCDADVRHRRRIRNLALLQQQAIGSADVRHPYREPAMGGESPRRS